MFSRLAACAFVFLSFGAVASGSESALENWAQEYRHADGNAPALITLTATLRVHNGAHYLAFRLTNVSKRPLRTRPFHLPWGNPNAVHLAAFTTDGKRLQNEYPLADPPYEELITIAPGQTIRGEQPIYSNVIGVDQPGGSDIIVLWSYNMFLPPSGNPKEAQDTAICTGAVVIPRAK